ncbi:MAG: hypothetical protein Q4E75_00060 [bacterium]|nr:hypothetical protein [bacterium]
MNHPTKDFDVEKCEITENSNLNCDGIDDDIIVNVEGKKPIGGSIVLDDGEIEDYKFIMPGDPMQKTVYRFSSSKNTGDKLEDSEYTTDYKTLNKDVYLKHIINEKNEIIGSSVCKTVNDSPVCIGDIAGESDGDGDGNIVGFAIGRKAILESKGISCNFKGTFEYSCGAFDIQNTLTKVVTERVVGNLWVTDTCFVDRDDSYCIESKFEIPK